MVSEPSTCDLSMEDEEKQRVQSYIRMQGMLRELSDQLRQISARSAADLAEIKRSIAARASSYTNGEEAPHRSVEPNLQLDRTREASLPSLPQKHKPTEKPSGIASVSSSGFSWVMEGSGELIYLVEAYVDAGRSESEQAVSLQKLASLLKRDTVSIESPIREMKLYLTTTYHISRSRGVLLLGEVVSSLSSNTMEKATIHNLSVFFVDRLADLRAQRGALVGCLALMRRKVDVGMLTIGDAKGVIQSFKKNLHVQTLGQHDRMLCFELLECLLEKYPKAVMSLGNDIFYLIREAAEYEENPDCLLHVFRIVRFVCQLFSDSSGPLEYEAEFRSTMIDSSKHLSYCALNYEADSRGQNVAEILCSPKAGVLPSPQELVFSSGSMGGLGLSNLEITNEALTVLAMVVVQNTDVYLELLIKGRDINMIFTGNDSVRSESNQFLSVKSLCFWHMSPLQMPYDPGKIRLPAIRQQLREQCHKGRDDMRVLLRQTEMLSKFPGGGLMLQARNTNSLRTRNLKGGVLIYEISSGLKIYELRLHMRGQVRQQKE